MGRHNKKGSLLKVFLVYFITAFFVLHVFMLKWGFMGDQIRNGFNKMMSYTAHKPFVHRVLTPILINSCTALVPENIIDSNKKWLTEDSPLLRYVRIEGAWNANISFKYHLTYLYLFLCLIILLFSMGYLTKLIYNYPKFDSDSFPAMGLLLLPLTFLQGGYFYDFPELLFMIFCLICLIKQRWTFYYIIFFLAVLNKESNVLLVLFFLAFRDINISRKSFLKHLLAQIFLGGIIYIVIRSIFATNPGDGIEFNLEENIRFWGTPRNYFLFFDPYFSGIRIFPRGGIQIFPRGGNILTVSILSFLIFYKWREKPIKIKRLFFYTFIVNFPLFIIFGWRDEIRALSFVFPSIYLLSVHSIYNLVHIHFLKTDQKMTKIQRKRKMSITQGPVLGLSREG